MEIVADASQWTQIDEEAFFKFLQTETGKRLLPRLAEMAPLLLEEGDTNKVLIRAGKLKGYQEALMNLLGLSHHIEEQRTDNQSAYPPLEDDSKWDDGNKIATT
jgi:hypothetical protein